MSYIEYERPEVEAMMNMFIVIKKLTKNNSVDQAVDVLDNYFKTGNETFLPKTDNIRDFVVENNLIGTFHPIYEEGYKHLLDYIEDLTPKKTNVKH